MTRLVVLDIVGLTPRMLRHMPAVSAVAAQGFQARLNTVLPAVTCSVQSTLLTGVQPSEHGVVGNGWYFRDLGEVLLWRQHNALVGGEKLWHTARRSDPGYTVANVCWWYAMGADVDFTVTPRPVYYSDGRKEPDCYTRPPALHDELTARLGPFPLFTYWGPNAGLPASQWILAAARHVFDTHRPDLTLVYVPHLDYEPQRSGPGSAKSAREARRLDDALRPLLDHFRDEDATVVILSEYGIAPASRPVDINRALREAGLLEVHTQDGMEYLDPWTSRAFAVADHQIAHVYVRDPAELLYDPTVPGVKARAIGQVARKKAGLRYRIKTVPLDPSGVRGSHGRLPHDPQDSPVLLCSRPGPARDEIDATDVKNLLLTLAGIPSA